MAEKSSENNPWSTLSTIDTLDKGNNSWMTRFVNDAEIPNGGQIVGRVAPSTSLLIESLIQQLCTMFEGDPLRRNKLYYAICDRLHEMKLIDSSYNKIEFDTMRGQYQLALYKLVAVARALTSSEGPLKLPSCLLTEWSRYRREFNEIEYIAKGGFGNVFKAQHRLDGHVYAIKKIIVRSGRVKKIMKHLEEVKTIAKLNHTNIVSYKGAWIEQNFPATLARSLPARDNSLTTDTATRSRCREKKSEKDTGDSARVAKVKDEKSDDASDKNEISGERISERLDSKNDDEDYSDVVSFRNETPNSSKAIDDTDNTSIATSDEIYTDEVNCTGTTDESDSYEEKASNEYRLCKFNSAPQYATLYIQMGLCDQTLRQWLDERKEPTPIHIVNAILAQILSGLEYIHSLNIVHHDIKPSNIFISKSDNLQIQLGDFGLACPLQGNGHRKMGGTPTYAAPEQLNGECDPKSDVYSLGIVLLELLMLTQTCMERSTIINELKKGEIPTALSTKYPQWAKIILQMVQENPKKRPSPTELLKHLSEDKDSIIAKLKEENVKKDDIIRKLQERINQLNETIDKHQILPDNTEGNSSTSPLLAQSGT